MDKILISGVYGTQNLGDEIILDGLTRLCRERYESPEVIAASIDPATTSSTTSVDRAISHIERGPSTWLTTVKEIDLIILGGGSVVNTSISPRHLLVTTIAAILGVEVYVIAGVSQGSGLNEEISRRYLQLVDGIAVRDHFSEENLRDMGIQDPIGVVPDPAFVPLEKAPIGEFDLSDEYVLVALSYKRDEAPSIDIPALASGLDEINRQYPHTIVFFPFQRVEGTDIETSKEVVRQMETDAVIFENEYTIGQSISILDGADTVVAMRLHSMILASHLRTPFTPISYNLKCDAFLDLIDAQSPLQDSNIDKEELVSMIQDNIENSVPISGSEDKIRSLEDTCDRILEVCDKQNRESSLTDLLCAAAILPRAITDHIRS